MSRTKRTIAIDFDGVLHEYRGYCGGLIAGPLPGAKAAVERLVQHGHTVVVFSTRPKVGIHAWLEQYGFPALRVTNVKEPFFVIVDDRALRFEGTWDDEFIAQIERFQPHWWQQAAGK